jgi:hypothetical protein
MAVAVLPLRAFLFATRCALPIVPIFFAFFSRNSYCVVIGSTISLTIFSRHFNVAIARGIAPVVAKRLRYPFQTVVTRRHADAGAHGVVSRAACMIRETPQLHPPAGDGRLHPQGVSR